VLQILPLHRRATWKTGPAYGSSLLTRIINRRLVYALLDADFFAEEQFGFLPGRSCPDAFHILLGAIEDAKESDSEIHVCLIDLTKAFDSLSPKSLQ
jgi:hypothetical protein